MPITTFLSNKIIDHMLRNQAYTPPAAIYFSLHDDDPGDLGANEIAVTRVAGTYSAANNKSAALSAALEFANCPATTVVGFSIWDALTAGNCLWTGFLTGAPKAFTGAADDLITCPAHGLVANDRVVFFDDGVGTLPTGLTEGVLYHVIATGLATDAFSVSLTQGGAAVNITATGQGLAAKVSPKTIANEGDTFKLNSAPVSIA